MKNDKIIGMKKPNQLNKIKNLRIFNISEGIQDSINESISIETNRKQLKNQ